MYYVIYRVQNSENKFCTAGSCTVLEAKTEMLKILRACYPWISVDKSLFEVWRGIGSDTIVYMGNLWS